MKIFDETEKQREYLRLYSLGYTDKEVAAKMAVAASIVSDYRRSLGLQGKGGAGRGGWRTNSTTRAHMRGNNHGHLPGLCGNTD